jgi:putative transposase
MQWPRLLAYISGRVDKELLVRNEYWRLRIGFCEPRSNSGNYPDGEKRTLAEIAHRQGKAWAEVAVAAKPNTILRWFHKLVARKFDGSA